MGGYPPKFRIRYSSVFMPNSNSCARCSCDVPSYFDYMNQIKRQPFLHQLIDLQKGDIFHPGELFDLAIIGSSRIY